MSSLGLNAPDGAEDAPKDTVPALTYGCTRRRGGTRMGSLQAVERGHVPVPATGGARHSDWVHHGPGDQHERCRMHRGQVYPCAYHAPERV